MAITEDALRTDFLDFCFEHMMDVEEYPGIPSVQISAEFTESVDNNNSKESGRKGVSSLIFLCNWSQNRAEYPRNLAVSATIRTFAVVND